MHDMHLRADDTLRSVIDSLPGNAAGGGEEVRVTCASRRLVALSSDDAVMSRTLRDLGLTPSASVVVRIGGGVAAGTEVAPSAEEGEAGGGGSGLAERAAKRRERSARGNREHTMQSVGIYSKDDNNKANLIDGGGGGLVRARHFVRRR